MYVFNFELVFMSNIRILLFSHIYKEERNYIFILHFVFVDIIFPAPFMKTFMASSPEAFFKLHFVHGVFEPLNFPMVLL